MARVEDVIAEIKIQAQQLRGLLGDDADFSPQIYRALAAVKREEFIAPALRAQAYANRALPLACGQTISQPFIVALMSQLLRVTPGQRILEIGTGSGYQAAVLAELGAEVYSVEVIPSLARAALTRLTRLGYGERIKIRCANGATGWGEYAPFAGVMVTAAAREVPAPLIAELRPGGRLVIPLGPVQGPQELTLLIKGAQGELSRRSILGVRFVPFQVSKNPESKDP